MSDAGTVVGVLLGVGGGGGLAMIGSLWRAYKKGKLEDESTLIERLNDDNKVKVQQARDAEAERDTARRKEQRWMEQAIVYRLQMVSSPHPITPKDIPELWFGVTPQIDPELDPPERNPG